MWRVKWVTYIYIYMVLPPQTHLRAFWYIVSTCIYIHIYYIYVHICIRVRSFFRCLVGSSCAHSKQVGNKKQYLTTILERIQRENPKNQKTLRKNQQETIFGDSLGKLYWQNQKNFEKTKKTKKQNFSENVWSEAHVCFFFGFPWFFLFFFLVFWPWKNWKKTFFCFFG